MGMMMGSVLLIIFSFSGQWLNTTMKEVSYMRTQRNY